MPNQTKIALEPIRGNDFAGKGRRREIGVRSIFCGRCCDVKLLQRTTREIRVACGRRFGETM